MDVFHIRDQLVHDYAAYVKGFLTIKDKRIEAAVHRELDQGLLWPEPLVQVNPAYAPGATIQDLARAGALHAECGRVFQLDKAAGREGRPLKLYKHQEDAIRLALQGRHYVLTTGTGSGKSLAYIVPIVDHVLKTGSGAGLKALIVYPMNALVNSQFNELDKFLKEGYQKPPVTYQKYTGQEKGEERERILANPPDILLTNYVMLELILTRLKEKKLVDAGRGLKFLVLDELHTYRGRQGADVALLTRRVRDAFQSPAMQCVGTSATLVDPDSPDPRVDVARVARLLFGVDLDPDDVIQETLIRVTPSPAPEFARKLAQRIQEGRAAYDAPTYGFGHDPLTMWVESNLGLATHARSGRLVRAPPLPIGGPNSAANRLAAETGLSADQCKAALQLHLVKGYEYASAGDPAARAMAFKIHQFFSRGGTPYASIQDESSRFLTLNGGNRHPTELERYLYPLVFCRECGKEYYVARREEGRIIPRDFSDIIRDKDDDENGPVYVYVNSQRPWDPSDLSRLPEDWVEWDPKKNRERVKGGRKDYLPEIVRVAADGTIGSSGQEVAIVAQPFRFCLDCGVSYNPRLRADFTKLLSLEREARSSATTVLTQSCILAMKGTDLVPEAQKLLSFTDNRQDASLQAGHFNDFNEVGALRAALYTAVEKAGSGGLRDRDLTDAVLSALALQPNDYTIQQDQRFGLDEAREALRDVLGYRIYRDLERGWRITSPNLEQCGLLTLQYAHLDEVCKDATFWKDAHPRLQHVSAGMRQELCRVLLDFLRHDLCIKTPYLEIDRQSRIKNESQQRLRDPWVIDEDEDLERSRNAIPRGGRPEDGDERGRFIGPRSNFGQYIKRQFQAVDRVRPNDADTERIVQDLFKVLATANLVIPVPRPRGSDAVSAYQLVASSLVWVAGDGQRGAVDVLRTPGLEEARTNQFFVEHYKTRARRGVNLRSAEHTAQSGADERKLREEQFGRAELPLLFCSPTMELGVDIKQLNAVNLRNVPPTPANYAQRSGRAGRGGQPAIVFTYCSRFSPHDQYFFTRRQEMVQGFLKPPRLDLTNQDLLRSHLQAIWLSEADLDLGDSLTKVIETEDPAHLFEVRESTVLKLRDGSVKRRAIERARAVLVGLHDDLRTTDWFTDDWGERTINDVENSFKKSLERWTTLLRNAEAQSKRQEERYRRSPDNRTREQAKRLQNEAQNEIRLLLNADEDWLGDFYSYRYFASEGFLPGYNFPRLPVSAYIPGRGARKGTQSYLNRPRFIAISEFGPRSILYHEGSTYRIVRVQRVAAEGEDASALLESAKLCGTCGYVHPTREGDKDRCESCDSELGNPLPNMFRLRAVRTKRARRINSDEEERRRLGFEIQTGIHYDPKAGNVRSASIQAEGTPWGRLVYSPNADVWRINLGERRRKQGVTGFPLDLETGEWAKSEQDPEDKDDPGMVNQTYNVVPFVQDHTNCLTLIPDEPLGLEATATLQAALKIAIQAEYQIEDRELSVEGLPNNKDRTRLLFWESSEGGAGVLRHLAEQGAAFARVCRRALELLHYNPDTGAELPPLSGREPCGGSCYECVRSYYNQTDHKLVDRKLVRDLLLRLSKARAETSPTLASRAEHYAMLAAKCDNDFEREWLKIVYDRGYRLPAAAQAPVEGIPVKPDFTYHDPPLLVFIDGPVHDASDIVFRDGKLGQRLREQGKRLVRFRYDERARWDQVFDEQRNVFGGA